MTTTNSKAYFGEGLRENPLSPEEKATLKTEKLMDEKYSNPESLAGDKDKMKLSLGGIGKLDPEEGMERARLARLAEAADNETEMGKIGETRENVEVGNENLESKRLSANEHPDAPFIDRLVGDGEKGDGVFTQKQGTEIKMSLDNGENFRDIINKSEIGGGIKSAIINQYDSLSGNDERVAEGNIKTFSGDYSKKLESISEISGISEGRMEDITSQIGRNYIRSNNPEEMEAAFDMAIGIAINTEFDTVASSFHRTLEFEAAFDTTKDNTKTKQERIEAYSDVLDMISTDIGAKGGGRKKENERQMKSLQLSKSGLQEKYDTAMKELHISQETGNKQKIIVAKKALNKIKELAKEVLDTPIGNFDTALDGEQQQSESTPQKAA